MPSSNASSVIRNSKFYPFIDLLLENNIIKNGTKYLIDISNNCTFVLNENKLKEYIYKNETFYENRIMNLPGDILGIFDEFIGWNICYGLNSMYAGFYNFFHKRKYKR
jgi:hypothetical protein